MDSGRQEVSAMRSGPVRYRSMLMNQTHYFLADCPASQGNLTDDGIAKI